MASFSGRLTFIVCEKIATLVASAAEKKISFLREWHEIDPESEFLTPKIYTYLYL